MSATTKVSRHDIRRVIFENFNDTDVRFSNDDILGHLNGMDAYRAMELDVLEFEDVLLEMEKSGLLRPIAQNFNTRYYRLWGVMERTACKSCGMESCFASIEDGKVCPQCKATL
ncbi:MAG TPA: hypothetical protein VIB07_01770 [Nitrososphaera sp.]|jgi:predicted Zn-ribbon and HTH transcriptional regulator